MNRQLPASLGEDFVKYVPRTRYRSGVTKEQKKNIASGFKKTGKFIQDLAPTTPQEIAQETIELTNEIWKAKNPYRGMGLYAGKKLIQNSPEAARALKLAKETASPYIQKAKAWLEKDQLEPVYAGIENLTGIKRRVNVTDDLARQSAQPLQMSPEQAVSRWKPVTHGDVGQVLTSAEKGADSSLSKITRYIEGSRWDELGPRLQKMVHATHDESNPLKYLIKYSGNKVMRAESHHILDIDIWGRALQHKDADIISHTLFKNKVFTGNSGKNIVWAWAAKTGSHDHGTLHKLYNQLPVRLEIEDLMNRGQWGSMSPKYVTRKLHELAYEQQRITNNFFRAKLDLLKSKHPELAKLNPNHLRNKILKDPVKYGQEALIDPKDIKQLNELSEQLNKLSGTNNKELQTVFGLSTPSRGASSYQTSQALKDLNLNFSHRLNEGRRLRQSKKLKVSKN